MTIHFHDLKIIKQQKSSKLFPELLIGKIKDFQINNQDMRGLATLLEPVRLPFNIFECDLNLLFFYYGEKAVKLEDNIYWLNYWRK